MNGRRTETKTSRRKLSQSLEPVNKITMCECVALYDKIWWIYKMKVYKFPYIIRLRLWQKDDTTLLAIIPIYFLWKWIYFTKHRIRLYIAYVCRECDHLFHFILQRTLLQDVFGSGDRSTTLFCAQHITHKKRFTFVPI